MDADDKVDIEKELSDIEERAKTRRRRSVMATLVPVALTGIAVLVFAYDIDKKRSELSSIEKQKRALDDELAERQGKLDRATSVGQDLESKVGRLRDEKKELEDYLRGLRNKAPEGAIRKGDGPESVVLSGEGQAPEGLKIVPRARITPRNTGRLIDVTFSLELPEEQTNAVKSVVYELNPVYYFVKRELEGGPSPTFESTVVVNACRSTVLAKITLEGGARMDVDFDWCRADGWPGTQKESLLDVQSETPHNSEQVGVAHPPPRSPPTPLPTVPTPPR